MGEYLFFIDFFKESLMKKRLLGLMILIVGFMVIFTFAGCGDNGDSSSPSGGNGSGGGGSGLIGSNPQIPSFARNAPTNANALASTFTSAGLANVEPVSYGGMEMVSAERTINGRVHTVVGSNYNTASMLAEYRGAWDNYYRTYGEAQFAAELARDGITNFNWNSNSVSWTEDGYDCFFTIVGDWWFAQGPN
jgi:hypothetical protein